MGSSPHTTIIMEAVVTMIRAMADLVLDAVGEVRREFSLLGPITPPTKERSVRRPPPPRRVSRIEGKIIACVERGVSFRATAREVGCSRDHVRRVARERGLRSSHRPVDRLRRGRGRPALWDVERVGRYDWSRTNRQLAEEMGRSTRAVRALRSRLRRRGFDIPRLYGIRR